MARHRAGEIKMADYLGRAKAAIQLANASADEFGLPSDEDLRLGMEAGVIPTDPIEIARWAAQRGFDVGREVGRREGKAMVQPEKPLLPTTAGPTRQDVCSRCQGAGTGRNCAIYLEFCSIFQCCHQDWPDSRYRSPRPCAAESRHAGEGCELTGWKPRNAL